MNVLRLGHREHTADEPWWELDRLPPNSGGVLRRNIVSSTSDRKMEMTYDFHEDFRKEEYCH